MAESYIGITEADTPDAKLHSYTRTVGSDTVEDEAVVLTEPHLASYVVTRFAIPVATADQHIFQLMAGASLNVYIRRIEIRQYGYAAGPVEAFELRLMRVTSAGTGGSALTPSPLDPADSAAGATAAYSVTAAGTEGVTIWDGGYHYATAGTPEPQIVLDYCLPRMKSLKIASGTSNGIAIKLVSSNVDASASLGITVYFDEWAS